MATIIGAGQRYDRIIGVGGITTSIDGYVWSNANAITEPFPARMKAQGIAVNGDGNVFVAISDNGYAAYSEDLQAWSNVRLLDSDFTALGISWGNNGGSRPIFAIAGSRIYNDDNVLPGEYADTDQIAQILINETGNDYPWDQAFTHPETGSWFHNVRYFENITINGITTDAWIAVGHANGQPDIWYTENVNWTYGVSNVVVTAGGSLYNYADVSFISATGEDATATATIAFPGFVSSITVDNPGSRYDTVPNVIISGDGVDAAAVANIAPIGPPDPYTWQRVSVPDAFADRTLYDVQLYAGKLYFSGRGMVIYTDDIVNGDWNTSRFITTERSKPDFVQLAINPDGHAVAVSSGGLIYSKDLEGWTLHSELGYQFTSIAWFNDHWIAGAYSLLTQHTYFTSTDGTNWVARNNGIQMYGMVSY